MVFSSFPHSLFIVGFNQKVSMPPFFVNPGDGELDNEFDPAGFFQGAV
jgi:hypothetical protein